jgi:hypothetical protein
VRHRLGRRQVTMQRVDVAVLRRAGVLG